MSKPVFVLVPGMFHGPAEWDAVASRLRAEGHQVLTPPLATTTSIDKGASIADKTSLDDVISIHELMLPALDKGNEVVLVGHSYGSLPATLAVEGQTVTERKSRALPGGVRSLVVVTGFAWPVRGKSIMADDNDPPVPDFYVLKVSRAEKPNKKRTLVNAFKNGVCEAQREKTMETLYHDLPAEKHNAAWSSLYTAHSRKSLCAFPRFIASDITTIPKTWVLAEKDNTIAPAHQEMFIQFGKFDNVERVDAGHMLPVVAAEKLSEVLLSVAKN